ncbi:unnamed protein product, partial [Polarella glacialis]
QHQQAQPQPQIVRQQQQQQQQQSQPGHGRFQQQVQHQDQQHIQRQQRQPQPLAASSRVSADGLDALHQQQYQQQQYQQQPQEQQPPPPQQQHVRNGYHNNDNNANSTSTNSDGYSRSRNSASNSHSTGRTGDGDGTAKQLRVSLTFEAPPDSELSVCPYLPFTVETSFGIMVACASTSMPPPGIGAATCVQVTGHWHRSATLGISERRLGAAPVTLVLAASGSLDAVALDTIGSSVDLRVRVISAQGPGNFGRCAGEHWAAVSIGDVPPGPQWLAQLRPGVKLVLQRPPERVFVLRSPEEQLSRLLVQLAAEQGVRLMAAPAAHGAVAVMAPKAFRGPEKPLVPWDVLEQIEHRFSVVFADPGCHGGSGVVSAADAGEDSTFRSPSSWDVKKGQTPYVGWCKNVAAVHSRPERHLVFKTAGRAPINSPPHPARLDAVQQLAQTSPAPPGGGLGSGADGESSPHRSLPRSFSGECCRVLVDQSLVGTFNAHKVYDECDLFRACSPGFIQQLITIGGAATWHGKTFDCGTVLYTECEAGHSMFIVVRGTIELTHRGDKASTRIMGRGECFGVAQGLGVLSERQETATARTSAHVLEVTLAVLTKLLSLMKDPEEISLRGNRAGASQTNMSGSRPSPPPCAFAEERRHFEHEAHRLYRQSRPKRQRRQRVAANDRSAGEEEGADAANAGIEDPKDPSSSSSKTPRSPTKANGSGSPRRRPPAMGEADAEGEVAAHVNVSCLQHPRKWRAQLQQIQSELLDGAFQDSGAARDRYKQRLNSSIRTGP